MKREDKAEALLTLIEKWFNQPFMAREDNYNLIREIIRFLKEKA